MADNTEEVIPNQTQNASSHIKIPKRKIIIEPFQFLFAVSIFPMMFISQQYLVARITYDKTNHSIEITNGSSGSDHGACDVNKSSPEYQFQNEVQEAASQFSMYSSLLQNLPALFVTIFLGSYSDKKGRKYAIIIPVIGNLISCFMYFLVVLLHLPIWCLFIGSVLNGCCGSYQTLLMGCFAYISDQTTPEQRRFRITTLELIMFASGILGPLGVGVWIEKMGFLPPLIFVVSGLFLSLLYVIFLVPETIIPDPEAKLLQFDNIKKTVLLFSEDSEDNRLWKLWSLFVAFMVIGMVYLASVDQLFEMNHPLCWGSAMIGYFSAAYIGVGGIGGFASAKLIKFCLGDVGIAFLAGLASCANSILKGFVANTIMMFCTVAFAPFSILFIPTIRALMSKLVGPTEQGSVFGAIAFAEVICSMVGNLTVNAVYKSTLHIHSGLVFFYMALIYLVGTTIIGVYAIKIKLNAKKYRQLENIDEASPHA